METLELVDVPEGMKRARAELRESIEQFDKESSKVAVVRLANAIEDSIEAHIRADRYLHDLARSLSPAPTPPPGALTLTSHPPDTPDMPLEAPQ